jgi:myo-inositol catabolism protein IolC
MPSGYERPLYVLPFDHRGSFQKNLFGWSGTLTPEQTAQISAFKQVIYEAFQAALTEGVPADQAGILVDEQFGAAILRDAVRRGYVTAMPAEKSGQDEFDFEYGADYARHIEEFNPTFCKVLVRYNPEGDRELNRRQAGRLRELSQYLQRSGRLFMFELLVPPTAAQLARVQGQRAVYDAELRPALMVQAIAELQEAGVEPDVWKIEGLERRTDCEKVAAACRRGGRERVGCIVLGRGEDDAKVRHWLQVAAPVPGFIGFAVGRTTFWEPLVAYRASRISRAEAVRRIAANYRSWVELFTQARQAA